MKEGDDQRYYKMIAGLKVRRHALSPAWRDSQDPAPTPREALGRLTQPPHLVTPLLLIPCPALVSRQHFDAYSVDDGRAYRIFNISAFDLWDTYLRQFKVKAAAGPVCPKRLAVG